MSPRDLPDDLFAPVEDDSEKERATQALHAFAPPRVPRSRKQTLTPSEWSKALVSAERMMGNTEWKDALPRDFVAVYAILHEEIYGVEPAELTAEARYRACMFAAVLLEREFHGDKTLFADYLRWTWSREEGREKWRRDNKRSGGRIAWQAQFMPGNILSDWRVDHVRRGAT